MIPQEQWDECLKFIGDGLSNKDAYQLAGISKPAFYLKKKEDLDFIDRLKKAELKFKHTLVTDLKTTREWQAKAWLLERKFKKEFGRIDRVEQKINHTINKASQLSDDELASIAGN